jgi:hypothetical protein
MDPGKKKLDRWSVALHEAAHAIAFSKLCHARSKVMIFSSGEGLCIPRIRPRFYSRFNDAVSTRIGDLAAEGHWSTSVPRIRPRRSASRPQAFFTVPTDAVFLDRARKESEIEFRLGSAAAPLDLQQIEDEAHRFLGQHCIEIWDLALKLFRDGRACVPAR